MSDLLVRYNYDSFLPEKFESWLNFDSSPKTGTVALDFPLSELDENKTSLADILKQHAYTIVEFGSFT
jgi:hypothetical protein